MKKFRRSTRHLSRTKMRLHIEKSVAQKTYHCDQFLNCVRAGGFSEFLKREGEMNLFIPAGYVLTMNRIKRNGKRAYWEHNSLGSTVRVNISIGASFHY